MSVFSSPLENVRVAVPCSADWNQMTGDERVRFCGQCNLNVYNLSGMTKREAESLVTEAEGRLCIRYYRRADGTILTRNCPVGLTAIKRRFSSITRAILSAVLSFLAGTGVYLGLREKPSSSYTTMGVMAAPTNISDHNIVPTERENLPVAGRMAYEEVQMEVLQGKETRRPVKTRKRFRR
jgi:hypothetical protein